MNKKEQIEVLKKTIEWFKKQVEPHDCGWMYTTIDGLKHRTISKKARKAINKDKPFLGLIFIVLYLPTRVLGFILDTIWWNRYRKWCKEVEIIKKELKSYE